MGGAVERVALRAARGAGHGREDPRAALRLGERRARARRCAPPPRRRRVARGRARRGAWPRSAVRGGSTNASPRGRARRPRRPLPASPSARRSRAREVAPHGAVARLGERCAHRARARRGRAGRRSCHWRSTTARKCGRAQLAAQPLCFRERGQGVLEAAARRTRASPARGAARRSPAGSGAPREDRLGAVQPASPSARQPRSISTARERHVGRRRPSDASTSRPGR